MLKLTMRQIRSSLGRFLAIAAIVALGVGFFCGLRLTKTAMVHTLDDYAEAHRMYDFRLVSTVGFDETDAEALAADDARWRPAREKRARTRWPPSQMGRRSRAGFVAARADRPAGT